MHQKVIECRDRYGCDGEDGDDDEGTTRMRALLCVSGGHPARRLPFLGGRAGILADSADLLREASRCRDTLGSLALGRESLAPGDPFELWCVENPLQAFDGGFSLSKVSLSFTRRFAKKQFEIGSAYPQRVAYEVNVDPPAWVYALYRHVIAPLTRMQGLLYK